MGKTYVCIVVAVFVHPVPMICDLIRRLRACFARQALQEALPLVVSGYRDASEIEPRWSEVVILNDMVTYSACRNSRAPRKKRHLEGLFV